MKKAISILLTFALLLGALPIRASAGEMLEAPFTRASFCQFLVDGLELKYDASMTVDFSDVPATHPNYQAIAILVHTGLVIGSGDGTFYPESFLSRSEAASLLYRLGLPGSVPETMPSDVSSYSWYYEAVVSVLGTGVMLTDADGLFRPYDHVYSSEINLKKIQSLLFATATSPVQLDLSQGSITISKNVLGITAITQGAASIRTEDTNILIRQSGATTANTISVNRGDISITLAGVNIEADSSAISTDAGVSLTLNLIGENTADGGVHIPQDAALMVQGTGKLVAVGAEWCAGIGGDYRGTGGTIVINGGTIIAVGHNYGGAGIGGGVDGDGGSIVINGGTITATGHGGGAGIGGGGDGGDGGNVVINDGTITATGGGYGAGIGGGSWGDGGNIVISGGTITATSNGEGAGIGGGCGGGNDGHGGNITITGGNITANGGYCAIGGGGSNNMYGCDSLTIGEAAVLSLSHDESNGYDLQERIFDLNLPASAASLTDRSLGLSAEARSHSGIASYQWQTCATNGQYDRDWTDIESQTAAAYTAPMTSEQDGRYFRCKITNVYGNVAYTDVAQGFVLAFKQQPQNVETGLNQTVALNATSTCSNVAYRWQRSYDEGTTWADVPGENYATLLLSTTRSENGALYRCVITASNGDELASNSARITVETGEQTYTVRYYQENADGNGYTVVGQDVFPGETGQTVTAPEKTFEGFSENKEKGNASGMVSGSLILSRYFDRNTYEIAFQMNGGPAVPTLSGKYGAPLSAPVDPSRYGYQFAGWYADAGLTQPYTFGTMPLNGAVVYANWIPKGQGRGIEYRIEELTFRNADTYEAIGRIPSRDFLAEVTVTNLASSETDTVLLITYDKKGKMLGMSYLYANPQIGQTITLGTRVQNSDGQVGKVKALVLPSLSSPIPLANAVERS